MTITVSDLWWIIPVLIWDLIWKGLALWYSAQKRETVWFVALLFLNTVGILPIAYLLTHQERSKK